MRKTYSSDPPQSNEPLLYGLTKVGQLLGISRSKVDSLCKSGSIPFIRIGGRRLVENSQINAFIQRMKHQQVTA